MSKKKILISWHYIIPLKKNYREILKKNKIDFDYLKSNPSLSEKDLIKVIKKYDGILCGDDEINKNVIDIAKNLKVISKWGTGMNSIDLEYAKKKKIKVFNSPKAFVESVSKYAFGMLINLARGIHLMHLSILRNRWEKFSGISLSNKKLGVIGFGNIGSEIAKLGKSMGFKILVNDINQNLKKKILQRGYKFLTKKRLIQLSDFIIICADLNNTSYHLFDKKEFKIAKKNLVLINIARGPLINEKELVKSLKKNKHLKAGLDVLEIEPLPKKSYLRNSKNVLLSSHNAFNTIDAVEKTNDDSINNIIKGLKNV